MTYDSPPAGPAGPRRRTGGRPGWPVGRGNVAVATAVQVEYRGGRGRAARGQRAVAEGTCAGLAQPSVNPAPMRLFHLSIAYLTLLFAVIAVTALLPWGGW